MSFLSTINNVHLGFINKVPLFWLPDGGDLHSLISSESKMIPKRALPNHLILGDASSENGSLLLNIDTCVIHFLEYVGGLNSDEDIEENYSKSSPIRGIYKSIDSVLYAMDESEESSNSENKEVQSFKNLKIDLNHLNQGIITNLYSDFASIFEKRESGYFFDFKVELQVAIGAFVVQEMPLDYCIASPMLRAFAHKVRAMNCKDLLSERGLDYLSMFSGVLDYNLQGRWNNKRGQTTWGFSLNKWFEPGIKKNMLS